MKKNLIPFALIAVGAVLLLIHFTGGIGSGDLDVKISNAPVVMPAAHKVYANNEAGNGRYYLFKMLLTNNGSGMMKNVVVSFQVPGFIDWTEVKKIKTLAPGQSTVVTCYPKFKDDVVSKNSSSKEKTEIKIEYGGLLGGNTIEEEFDFEMTGRNDMVYSCVPKDEIRSYKDMFENDELICCFVTPEDPIIKYYTQQIQEKVMKGEAASVNQKPEDAVKFLAGIYEATYMSHMVYSGTSGVPKSFDDVNSITQHIRLPRELVTGNTGLCIELSALYASVMLAAGLEPVIFFVPGHAYPGVKVQGQYFAIEATAIGGEGMGGRGTAQQALETGMKNLNEFMKAAQAGDERYTIVDVNEVVKSGIKPMELKDDQFLRQKIDEIARTFNPGQEVNYNQGQQFADAGNTNNGGDGGGGNGRTFQGAGLSFSYPPNWYAQRSPYSQYPFVHSVITSPDQAAYAEVYSFNGAGSVNNALAYLEQQLSAAGVMIQYSPAGSQGGYQIYNGQSSSENGNLVWTAYFKNNGGNVSGVVIGGYSQSISSYQNQLMGIASSIR
ncbi:MAG: hypothetical protein IPP71_09420 [Bacteroidetes bacterium]|nr:hypothetical protein [Bacteroidota bacterium]